MGIKIQTAEKGTELINVNITHNIIQQGIINVNAINHSKLSVIRDTNKRLLKQLNLTKFYINNNGFTLIKVFGNTKIKND